MDGYGLSIFSHVIYLRPNVGRSDPGGYVQDVTGHRLIVEYKVIRLIEVEGQSVLEAQQLQASATSYTAGTRSH